MAILNIRSGGVTYSYNNANEYKPSYGSKRLNIRINSTSIAQYGLTNNTNGSAYCKLMLRAGGVNYYLGRSTTVSYVSGNTPPRNNSTMTSSSTYSETTGRTMKYINTKEEYFTVNFAVAVGTASNATGSSSTVSVQRYEFKSATALQGQHDDVLYNNGAVGLNTASNNTGSSQTIATVKSLMATKSGQTGRRRRQTRRTTSTLHWYTQATHESRIRTRSWVTAGDVIEDGSGTGTTTRVAVTYGGSSHNQTIANRTSSKTVENTAANGNGDLQSRHTYFKGYKTGNATYKRIHELNSVQYDYTFTYPARSATSSTYSTRYTRRSWQRVTLRTYSTRYTRRSSQIAYDYGSRTSITETVHNFN